MRYIKKPSFNMVITLLFFGALALYFTQNQQALNELLAVPLWAILLLLIFKTLRILSSGLFTKLILEAFGKHISLKETNYLSFITTMGNFFGPILGGAGIRAYYLKKKHGFNYAKFISTLYGFYIISFLTNALLGLIVLFYIYLQSGVTTGIGSIALVFAGIFFGTFFLTLFPSRLIRRLVHSMKFLPKKISHTLIAMIEGWSVMKNNGSLLAKLAVLNVVVFTFAFGINFILYELFVKDFSLASVILYTVLGTFVLLVSITPGAIGIREAIYLFTSSTLSLTSSEVLQMAAVERSTTFLLLFVTFIAIKVGGYDKRLKNLDGD